MTKPMITVFSLFSLFLVFSGVSTAQTSTPTPSPIARLSTGISCDLNIYKVYGNSSLPYQYNGTEVPSGTRTNSEAFYVYSLNVKNNNPTNTPQTTVYSLSTTNISGASEPITVLDYKIYPPNSSCSYNPTDKTVSCQTSHAFADQTRGFMQMLVKTNKFPSDKYNTSTLFSVTTNMGKAECATMLMLDASVPINNSTPVKWQTKFASFSASQFLITIDGTKYFRGKEPVSIHSDGYDDGSDNTYTTLESTWYEDPQYDFSQTTPPANPVEMRLFMYFKRENTNWKMTEMRAYNGNKSGDWLWFKDELGNQVSSIVGYHDYALDRVFTEVNGRYAKIICHDCEFNAFMDLAGSVYNPTPTINTNAPKILNITNEPGTWSTIKANLTNYPLQASASAIRYDWNTETPGIINLENLNLHQDNSTIRINGSKIGKTAVVIKAIDMTLNNKVVATSRFTVNVTNYQVSPSPKPNASPSPYQCVYINQPVFKDQGASCCSGLSLVPSADDQANIVGYCVDKSFTNQEYDRLKQELSDVKTRLNQTEVKQSALQQTITGLQTLIDRILKLLRIRR